MGFSDRFKEAAEAARTTLQDQGLCGAGTIRGIRSLDRPDDDLAAAARAKSLGAPDPYTLITHDEVVALTGLPVGGPYLSWTDDDIGVRYVAEDGRGRMWSFGVHAGHSADGRRPFDAASWYRWMIAMLDGAETVRGLGHRGRLPRRPALRARPRVRLLRARRGARGLAGQTVGRRCRPPGRRPLRLRPGRLSPVRPEPAVSRR